MKLMNEFFTITIVNNEQIGEILQTEPIGGQKNAKGFILIAQSNTE